MFGAARDARSCSRRQQIELAARKLSSARLARPLLVNTRCSHRAQAEPAPAPGTLIPVAPWSLAFYDHKNLPPYRYPDHPPLPEKRAPVNLYELIAAGERERERERERVRAAANAAAAPSAAAGSNSSSSNGNSNGNSNSASSNGLSSSNGATSSNANGSNSSASSGQMNGSHPHAPASKSNGQSSANGHGNGVILPEGSTRSSTRASSSSSSSSSSGGANGANGANGHGSNGSSSSSSSSNGGGTGYQNAMYVAQRKASQAAAKYLSGQVQRVGAFGSPCFHWLTPWFLLAEDDAPYRSRRAPKKPSPFFAPQQQI